MVREPGDERPAKLVVKLADGTNRSIQHITSTRYWGPDGKPLSPSQFLESLFGALPDFFQNEDEQRTLWADPSTRKGLLNGLPTSNIFGFGNDNDNDENFLISAGILTRPMIHHQGGNAATIVLDTFLGAMKTLEASEPGVWSLSQGERSLFLENYPDDFYDNWGISLILIRSIPIPSHDVPITEILEFKEKRRDELNILHTHINKLSAEISLSKEIPLDLEKTVKNIDVACADLLKVSSEWQQPFHIGDLKANINFNGIKALGVAGAAWKLAEPYGLLAATAAATSSGIISAIDIKADIGFRSIKRTKTPYHYAWLAHRELV
jgi:hypothetical protein